MQDEPAPKAPEARARMDYLIEGAWSDCPSNRVTVLVPAGQKEATAFHASCAEFFVVNSLGRLRQGLPRGLDVKAIFGLLDQQLE